MNSCAHRKEIRSIGVTKVNRLVRAAAHLADLREAFADWTAGEIFICKKNGAYRYRFGDQSKMETPWSCLAQRLFSSPAEFAFAAMVFENQIPQEPAKPKLQAKAAASRSTRVNVLSIAREVAA